MRIAHLDYETRSGADLKRVGPYRYAIDLRFDILLASVSETGSEDVHLWVNPRFRTADLPGDGSLAAEEILAQADVIVAHNAPFESAVTWGAQELGRSRPIPDFSSTLRKWRCTGAMARKAGLPWSLDGLGEALRLGIRKDPRGKDLIRFFCVPREDGGFNEPRDFPEKWMEFGDYCARDNRVERTVYHRLAPFDLTGGPLEAFLFDLRMNQRGVPINLSAAKNAQKIIDAVQGDVGVRFLKETGLKPTQRGAVLELVRSLGVEVGDMQSDTLDGVTASGRAAEILGLYRKLSFAAVKKVRTMLDCACPDGRVRGAHLYYGAGTGRWSSKLLQVQNMRKTDPQFRAVSDEVYRSICRGGTAESLDVIYGEPLQLIANCIRNFVHLEGVDLLDGDYSAIEARIICWLAGQNDVLEMWRRGHDLYKWMAAHLYGIPESGVSADARECGKRIILGAGFGMGPDKFHSTCRDTFGLDLPLELCQRGIKLFRTLCPRIVAYWNDLARSARRAIQNPGIPVGPFVVRPIAGIDFLLFRLRSGRSLAYPHPRIEMVPWKSSASGENDPADAQWREQITYWGQIPGSTQWGGIKLYGGKLAENETQATAADIMAFGSLTAEERGMPPFLLLHDQALALRDKGQSPEQFAAALARTPEWAAALPLKVEARVTPWFKK